MSSPPPVLPVWTVLPLAGRPAKISKLTWSSKTPLELPSSPNPSSSTSPVPRPPSLPFRRDPPPLPRKFCIPSFHSFPADPCISVFLPLLPPELEAMVLWALLSKLVSLPGLPLSVVCSLRLIHFDANCLMMDLRITHA